MWTMIILYVYGAIFDDLPMYTVIVQFLDLLDVKLYRPLQVKHLFFSRALYFVIIFGALECQI